MKSLIRKYLSPITYKLSPNEGFTLIELLIVIVIIGILSAFVTVNIVGVRERARDSQRKSDLKQIRAALEMYMSDKKNYPYNLNWFLYPSGTSIGPALTPYMKEIPDDPSWTYCYSVADNYKSGYLYYSSDGSQYTLYAILENDSDPEGATHVKAAPNEAKGNISSDNKTITLLNTGSASCDGKIYNYWVNNP